MEERGDKMVRIVLAAMAAAYDLGQVAMRLKLTEFTPIPSEPCS